MKKPTYDWEWFQSKKPFKKILEDTCGLVIEKEVQRIPTVAGCYCINNHYRIKVNYERFASEFDSIKSRLLNTNVCKKNPDVFSYVNEKQCSVRTLCNIIQDGCMADICGSYEWDFSGGCNES